MFSTFRHFFHFWGQKTAFLTAISTFFYKHRFMTVFSLIRNQKKPSHDRGPRAARARGARAYNKFCGWPCKKKVAHLVTTWPAR